MRRNSAIAALILAGIIGAIATSATAVSVAQTAGVAPTAAPEFERADLNRGVWARGPNLPSPRQDAAAAVIAGRIYLIGGFGPHNTQMDSTLVWEPEIAMGEPRGEVERAGVRLGVWTYAAPIPEPVDHAAAAAIGSYIYVAGGRIEDLVTNKFWRYNAANDVWIELPSMPIPRYGASMQAIGDELYLVGGAVSHGNDATSMEVYDTTTNRWSVDTYALGAGRAALASSVLDDNLVVLGGRDDQERNLSVCDVYDPTRHHWSTCSYLRQPRSDFGLSAVNGRLVAVGGDDLRDFLATQTTEISEPRLDGWLSGPWLPGPRHGMAQVTLGNVVWVMGGASSTGTAPSTFVARFVSPIVKVKFKGRA
jgi:N-acetylneuraminic acid mutarotase